MLRSGAWTAAAAGRSVHTSEHSAGIRLVERLYATHRVKIISRIFSKPPRAFRVPRG